MDNSEIAAPPGFHRERLEPAFFGIGDTNRIDAAYPGETLAQLRRIKAEYDPTNLFRNNDNIQPDYSE